MMFESLSAEQITDIHNTTVKIKMDVVKHFRVKNKYTNKINDLVSEPENLVNMVMSEYNLLLAKDGIIMTDDIKNAVKVFCIYSMSDEKFLDFKKKFNSDYEKMGKLYGVTASYPRCRHKIILQKKRCMLDDQMIDDIIEKISDSTSLKKEYKR